MKLENIALDKINIVKSFNIRSEFGEDETKDLEQSIKSTGGNIQPLLVIEKDGRFDLVSGERRYRALKEAGYVEALCIVYNTLSDVQKTKIMFNENLGRKNLTWSEEVKGIKKLKNIGLDITQEVLVENQKISKVKAWNLIEALQAVEEFPDLINEPTRKSCIIRWKQIKKLEKEKQDAVKSRTITIKEALTTDKLVRQKNIETMVIEELKHEVNHYKEQFKNVHELVKKLDKMQRLDQGIWLIEEVKQIIEAARCCETFSTPDSKDEECILCRKEAPLIFSKCEFFHEEFKARKKNES